MVTYSTALQQQQVILDCWHIVGLCNGSMHLAICLTLRLEFWN